MDSIKSTTDILTCPVCRQLFNNPRFLPCYHFYCEQCLEKLQVQSKISCPECRQEAIVPLGGVKQLRSNFLVNRLVEELVNKRAKEGDEEVQCDNCDENDQVVGYCPNCSTFLCELCYRYHKRDRITRNHHIVLFSEIITIPDEILVNTLQCQEHGSNELQYYCETCDELICMYCTIKEHNGHSHDVIKKMAGKFRHIMNENIATAENMFKHLSKLHDDIETMINQIRDQENEVIRDIKQHYTTLVDKIIEQGDHKEQQVHKIASEKVKALTQQQEELDSIQMQFLYMKELHDSAKKSSNPDKVLLSLQKQVKDYTKKLTEAYNTLQTEPVELDTIQFFVEKVHFPQFGQVFSAADPSVSELLSFPKYAFKDVPVEFSVNTKYGNGCHYSRGGNHITVQTQLQLESGNTESIVSSVTDNKNGTYTATLTAHKTGRAKVSVLLDGEQIKDSPCNFPVGRNYRAISKPSNIVQISGHWAVKPWGIAFGNNNVWAVADWAEHCIHVFHKHDQLLWKFGSKGSNKGQLDGPCGIAFDKNNYLYVADYNNRRVQKFDINGNCILHFKETGDGCLGSPVDVTVHEDKVYVADSTANRIVKFSSDGQFCQVIGKGLLDNPNGVTVSRNNHLLVTNLNNNSIYVFRLDGQYLGKFGALGPGLGHLSGPRSITTDANGFILVTDTGNDRITIFDQDGKCVHCFGSKGKGNSQFINPRGIALSHDDSLYICDTLNNCIKIFKF